MSQRECAGFNCPPASIPAVEPVSRAPEVVRRMGVASSALRGNWPVLSLFEPSGLIPSVAMPGVSFQSRLEGHGQLARATVRLLLSVFPAAL